MGWEILKCLVGKSEYTLPGLVLGFMEKFSLPPTHPTSARMIAMCDELARELQVR